VDAGLDGSASDAGLEATARTWCDSLSAPPTFCADFDTAIPLAGWDSAQINGGATLDASVDGYVSPPRSLLATKRGHDAGQLTQAQLTKSFPFTPRTLHLEYALRIDSASDNAAHAEIQLSPSYRIILYVNTSTSQLAGFFLERTLVDGGGYQYAPHPFSTPPLTAMTWNHVSVDLALGSPDGGGSAQVWMNDAAAMSDPIRAQTGASFQLYVGIEDFNGNGPWEVQIDNVLLTAQ
jgi:hypothetical protein